MYDFSISTRCPIEQAISLNEFKQEAVRLAQLNDRTCLQVADELVI